MKHIIFKNARVIMPDAVLKNHYVYVIDGLIKSIDQEPVPENLTRETEIINCQGNYLSPGFIDTHCHGGGGADFMDGTVQDILIAARAHLKHGTTALCPTTLTCSDQELFRFLNPTKQRRPFPNICHICLESIWKVPIFLLLRREPNLRNIWFVPSGNTIWKSSNEGAATS